MGADYLESGWYETGARWRLRPRVVDAAADVAGTMLRASVPTSVLTQVTLKVRGLVTVADPLMRGTNAFAGSDREIIGDQLDQHTQKYPALAGFVADCLEHVRGPGDLAAFYLHLLHVTRMVQLLAHAREAGLSTTRATRSQRSRRTIASRKKPKSRSKTL